jgi:hypothetical protein
MTEQNSPATAGAEALAVEPSADASVEVAKEALPEEGQAQEEGVAKEQTDQKEKDPWPSSAKNAVSRRDKQLGKLRAEKYQILSKVQELEQKLSQYQSRQQVTSKAADDEGLPDINQFSSHDEYMRALAAHETRRTIADENKRRQDMESKSQQQAWEDERIEHLDKNSELVQEAFSDFEHTLQENADILTGLAPHVKMALYEAENGAFATYALAKDGLLEQLNEMSPARVAMIVARAEDKALAMAKTKTATKAPTPLQPVRGTAQSKPPILDQLGDDSEKILAWLKSR